MLTFLPEPTDNRFYDEYEGQVVDVDDPERKGRVRVNVFGLFDQVPTQDLPWAVVRYPVGQRPNEGSLTPIKVNDYVYVQFKQGDTRYPKVTGSAHFTPEGLLNAPHDATGGPLQMAFLHQREEGESEGPAPSGYNQDESSTLNGVTLSRKADGTYLLVQRKSGTAIEVTREGHIVLHSSKGLFLSAKRSALFSFQSWVGKIKQALDFTVKSFSLTAKSKSENIAGSSKESVDGEKSITAGTLNLAAMGAMGVSVGGSCSSITKGSVEEVIANVGGSSTAKSTMVMLGNVEQSLAAGDYKISLLAGRYDLSNSSGSVLDRLDALVDQQQATLEKLDTLLTAVQALTVGTGVGTSSVALNLADFVALQLEVQAQLAEMPFEKSLNALLFS